MSFFSRLGEELIACVTGIMEHMSKGCRLTFIDNDKTYSVLTWINFTRHMVVINDGSNVMTMPQDMFMLMIANNVQRGGKIQVENLLGETILYKDFKMFGPSEEAA
jgi:hypothetical protein